MACLGAGVLGPFGGRVKPGPPKTRKKMLHRAEHDWHDCLAPRDAMNLDMVRVLALP